MEELFHIDSIEYSGVDNKVVRLQTRAKKAGFLDPNFYSMGVRIKNQTSPVRNEVKRKGILSEREVDIELRVGDVFIIYITRTKVSKK